MSFHTLRLMSLPKPEPILVFLSVFLTWIYNYPTNSVTILLLPHRYQSMLLILHSRSRPFLYSCPLQSKFSSIVYNLSKIRYPSTWRSFCYLYLTKSQCNLFHLNSIKNEPFSVINLKFQKKLPYISVFHNNVQMYKSIIFLLKLLMNIRMRRFYQ